MTLFSLSNKTFKGLALASALALSFLAAGANSALAASSATAKAELRSLVAKYKGFSANFTQFAKDPKGKVLYSSKGEIRAQKPNSMLMITKSPNELYLSVLGNKIANYDPFVEQVTLSTLKPNETVPFLYLLTESASAWANVEVKKGKNNCYSLNDKKISQNFKGLDVCVAGGNLKAVILYEKNGNSNTYQLSNFTPRSLSAADFKINYPENTTVKVLD